MQAGADTGKSILALDGGGVRGVISIAFLERIEALFADKAGAPVRLADRFDLIGGTSTGAIIATALALGLSASDVKAMYFELAPRVFRRSRFRLMLVQTRFDAAALRLEVEKVVGDRQPRHRRTCGQLLAIITKRLDTGGAWIVSNNPRVEILGEPSDRPPHRQPPLPPRRPGPSLDRRTVFLRAAGDRDRTRPSRRASSSMAASRRITTRRWLCSSSRPSPPMATAGRPARTGSASFRSEPGRGATG